MKNIDQCIKGERIAYKLFWGIMVLTVVGFESGLFAEGLYAADARMEYLLQTVAILLAILLIPVSLKLFSWALTNRVRPLPLLEALKCYRRWSLIRLVMMGVAALSNLVVYYLTLNQLSMFCALMAMVASLFCWPSSKRILNELNLTEE